MLIGFAVVNRMYNNIIFGLHTRYLCFEGTCALKCLSICIVRRLRTLERRRGSYAVHIPDTLAELSISQILAITFPSHSIECIYF